MRKLIKISRLFIAVTAWALYELFLDGSGIGLKERWEKIREWSEA